MNNITDNINTTLCYIEKDGAYLMMHRVKKQNDLNRDKWVGIGGKFEKGENPFDCAYREIKEETGVRPVELKYRGIVKFVSDVYGTEYMHLFTADGYEGEINYDCSEGVLEWVEKGKVTQLPLWQGDKIFLKLLDSEQRFFYLTLIYEGETLTKHELNF